ncbi:MULTISPECIES: hypothetical protein [unclassified Oscillibacter]|uniref:hypothetical protein n=1 Tax=unclassified Oscillibacter TaxID=2629304 RepID=UPI0025D20CFB|nr:MULTISPECIES: hypothetical protein [unclassified Oscillibacter]
MALSRFEKNMQIIQALDDEPNDVGGMTATELKATFDEGGEAVKEYLNGVLVPALDTYIARVDNPHSVTKAQVGLGNCDNTADTDKPVSVAQTAAIATAKAEAVSVAASDATAKANVAKAEAISASDPAGAATSAVLQHNTAEAGVHTALFAKKLDKTGGTLTGPLTLSGAPTAALHAATKQYVDEVSAGVVLGQIPDGSITSEKLSGGVNTTLATSTAHVVRTDNPHSVTAAQVGADPSGSAAAVQANLNAHTVRMDNPHGVTAAQIGAAVASHTHTPAQCGADPAGSAAAVLAQLADRAKIATGSYVGTGTSEASNPTTIYFPFAAKILIIEYYPTTPSAGHTGFAVTLNIEAIKKVPKQSGIGKFVGFIPNSNLGQLAFLRSSNDTDNLLSLSIYSTGSDGTVSQFNLLNVTYNWVAIG